MNIFLIGYRCTGKTSVGKRLCELIKYNFVDADIKLSEEDGRPIAEIVNKEGWDTFRKKEKDVLKKICSIDNQVVATGGGVILDYENVEEMKRCGVLVWLKAKSEIIQERMLKDFKTSELRPSLTSKALDKEIEETLAERMPLYEKAMDFSFDTNDLTIDKISEKIINKLKLERKKPVKIGIIGGTGVMGQWFENFFTSLGYSVLIAGRKTKMTYKDLAKESQVVILSVPIAPAIQITKDIGPILKKDQMIMDFCSLKENILEAMLSNTIAEVIGTHPLFGPFTKSIKGQNIIICKGRGEYWLNWLEELFESNCAVITHIDPVKHDKNMAVVQGLTHLLSISLGKTLQKMNITPKEAMLFATPVFRLKMDLMARLFAQDLSLFADLIGKNKYVKDVIDIFLSSMNEGIKSLILEKNGINEIKFLENIREFIGDFSNHGLCETNEIFNLIYRKV